MIEIPRLDTIEFDALVEEARGLIPRYAPDWTDHNLHDPGITLLDLLAWMIDQQLYRIGLVGDGHEAAFAALLGLEPQGTCPARGLIWPHPDWTAFDLDLESGSRAQLRGQPDLAFTVSETIAWCEAHIVRAEARIGTTVRKVNRHPDGAVLLDPATDAIDLIFKQPIAGAAAPFALGLAYGEKLPDLGGRAPAAVSCLIAGDWRYSPAIWHPAPDGASGVFLLPAQSGPLAALRLNPGAGLPRRLLPRRIALNVIPVVQQEQLEGLKIGEGTGWPDLELPLGIEGGAEPAAAFEIVSGPNDTKWRIVNDFSGSGPEDADCVFDPGQGTVAFGNGVNGKLMPFGHEVSHKSLTVTRGAQGNLAAGAEWSIPGVSDAKGFGVNREPVCGGTDPRSRDDLLAALQRQARKRGALLTDPDLIAAAMAIEGLGIERAEVLPRFSPLLPRRRVPGARTLVLRPTSAVKANDTWLDAIETSLASRRVLGERLAVATVDTVPVEVQATLLVATGADRKRIGDEAEQNLRERLAIARQRSGQTIEPWPAGRPVTLAELETLLVGVEGVIAVSDLLLARAGQELAVVSIPLGRLEVAVAGSPVIRFEVES